MFSVYLIEVIVRLLKNTRRTFTEEKLNNPEPMVV